MLRHIRQCLAVAIATAAPLACTVAGPSAPAGAGFLQTDQPVYVARREGGDPRYGQYAFIVIARFTNETSSPVYLARCYPDSPYPIYGVELLMPIAGKERSGYSPAWGCVGHDQAIVVGPGEARTDTLRISGPTAVDGRTKQPLGALRGRMQLFYQVQACPQEACAVLSEVGASNAFEVRMEG